MEPYDPSIFPKKLPLSGSDCFHRVLDLHATKHKIGGNVMRQVFYFDEKLPVSDIRNMLDRSPLIYWLCNIKLHPGIFFKVPYWKYIDQANHCSLTVINCTEEGKIPESVFKKNIPLNAPTFIEADVIQYPSGKSAFVISWNHILLDAKGSALLIDHLDAVFRNQPFDVENFFPKKTPSIGLYKQIKNMYFVRDFIEQSSRKPIAGIPTPNNQNQLSNEHFHQISFNQHETALIEKKAFDSGARFGTSAYYLACAAHAQQVFYNEKNRTSDIWLPVPYDGRLKGKSGPIIGNSVSIIFYRLPHTFLNNIPELVQYLNREMKLQIAEGIPKKYSLLLNMMRHVPLSLYYFLVSRGSKSAIASFLYTTTGEHFSERPNLFGKKITGMQIIPALTHPPGFTLLFLKHNNQLSVNIICNSNHIALNRLLLFEEKLKAVLLGLP